MVNQVQRNLDKLESLTEPFFSENSERNGWKQVLDYINKNGGTAPDTIYGAFDYFDYRRDI